MNVIGNRWLSMPRHERLQWLEFDAWKSSKKFRQQKGPAGTGPKTKNMASPIISGQKGNFNMDRFQEDNRPESMECSCKECGSTLMEGEEALVTGMGIFCDYTCYGRYMAKQEGERETYLTREDIEDAAV